MSEADVATPVPNPVDVEAVWGVTLTAMHCAHCGRAHLVPKEPLPTVCPFCMQGPVAEQPAYLRPEPPEQVLPFLVAPEQLAARLEQWARGGWLRPAELKGSTLLARARRYFIPTWLVDAHVEGPWRADAGFDYQAVSYQDHYGGGQGWRSQEVTETRVRWEPRAGRLERSYENVPVPALDDHRPLLEALGPYNMDERAGYTADVLSGAAVRIPTLEPVVAPGVGNVSGKAVKVAWPEAESALARAAEADCQQAAGANAMRDFAFQPRFGRLNWTLLLLPAYVTWYTEGGRTWPVFVNAQSGRVSGVRRGSARTANTLSLVIGALALMLIALGGILAVGGLVAPPVSAAGAVFVVLGLVAAVLAPLPALGMWAFNRRSTLEAPMVPAQTQIESQPEPGGV